jgi:hypothetical protein
MHHYPTINGEEILDRFQQLMQPHSPDRVLRLLGQAKLGKSHLLTKVFPGLARQEQSACRYAILDLRSQAQGVPDVLHSACAQLGDEGFSRYLAEYKTWRSRPRVEASNLQALLSKISISARDEAEESRRIIPDLTLAFVSDLRAQPHQPALLLFDAVDNAADATRDWLMDSLLVQVAGLTHVRCVVAGRTVPDAAGGYAAFCASYELQPVTEEEAYIRFCQSEGIGLVEQSIRDIAKCCGYFPGYFVELAQPFRSGGSRG